ncbi:magnesium-translocating P-type ATPase [Niastella caeni]|uniref:Magnesium-transporting ATPase, P-type 1 n=1 Tax=Niastella caeni TaxID=2569763 RepID=A0A4S8HVA0_9BACT|nr:magnesium-translocating P-type ATPase [Niastella caeni]THU39547.1 magnesium-translocating P-type ATPase [Niastella caeni]
MITWHFSSATTDELFAQLQSSPKGLQIAVAAEREKSQAKLFKTEGRYKKEIKLLIRQFTNPLVLLLVIAVCLSVILGESSDSIIILIILLTTGLLGFWQELNASRAVEKLRGLTEMKHTVLRDNQPVQLSTRQIVPGDILLFDAGDIIPADCRIIECNDLHMNESTLTGESYPVEKSAATLNDSLPLSKKYNCLWQGTNVVSGSATAIAVQVGSETIFGQMSHSLIQTTETAFEKGIRHFGFFLLKATVMLSLTILLSNLYFQKPIFESILFSLALAVGMAPELLPAIMTFAMAAGTRRMLKKKVIVKKLSGIFNFGEVNVLCTDKTGTITEGVISVKDIVDITGKRNDRLRLFAFLNAFFQKGFTNPIDQAITSLNIPITGFEKINEIPYDFIRKRLSVAVNQGANCFFITKGAFKNVLEVCRYIEAPGGTKEPLTEKISHQLNADFITYSNSGYRVLGLSYKPMETDKMKRIDEQDMIFLGFILLEDPLKESTLSSFKKLEQLNIRVKIITGDNRFAAYQVSQKLGMKEPVILTGEEMNTLYPEALVVKARHTDIFAEIEPHQKELIIKALQKSHFTVAYIGDGINDAAAINAADVGISTNNAADIAREAADFVLMEKDLSVLADGVYEGRKSFINSMKYIFISTGATFGNMFSIAGASLFLPFLPMLPKQILLTNLVTDLPFLSVASDHVDDEELTKPQKWDLSLIRRFMVVFSLHSTFFDFLTFYILYHYFKLSNSSFQTGWFLESTITELLILFVVRTKKTVIKSKPGRLLLITSLIALGIIIYLPYSPVAALLGFSILNPLQIITITLILVAYIITADLLKRAFFNHNGNKKLR